jgi:succinate dehydrogenase/fumarate reductase flavoprotein subunit
MSYTPEMRESINRVEATREQRRDETYPRLEHEEAQAVLRRFHPDYIEEGMRKIRIGRNQGDRTPLELAAVLEAPPAITSEMVNLDRVDLETEVLVVGGGGAGASAALLANQAGAKVTLVTKLRFGDANTMMAQGGIQAADKPNDTPAIHYLDVMGGGHFCNDPDLVAALVMDAPYVIQWLEGLGCMFNKRPDGTMETIHGGGTSRKRMHYARDYSGAEIMRTLRDEVRCHPEIQVIEFFPVIELLTDGEGRVTGAVCQNFENNEYAVVRAKAVILATGGSGRLHYQGFPCTNHYGATADGLVLGYRVGAELAFLDTMQYHPTGAAYPEQIVGQLVTEKVRGLGAQLCNIDGVQFTYPLEPRDIEASAVIRECVERGKGVPTPAGGVGVWLDSPLIDLIHGTGTVARELPAMVRQFERFGIDMTREPILIYPTLHYQNGGLRITPNAETGVPGLYVAGEVAGGIHGRNRLMGNSLLDIVVFGRRSGRAAANYVAGVEHGVLSLAHLQDWIDARAELGLEDCEPAPILLPDYTRHARRPLAEPVR